jgi:hypothetical protein
MIEIIEFRNQIYPKFQSEGFASKFVFPFAQNVCKGVGYDIGCMKKEWAFPGSIPIDLAFNDGFHALNLPQKNVDYIFSSHCLEHIQNWSNTLEYWLSCLKEKGVLFLYLPHWDQEYWRPWFNKKHVNVLTPNIIKQFLIDHNMTKIFVSERDLNHSFSVMAEK